MDIQPLNGILSGIGSGGEWDEQRQLQRLIGQWEAIVGATVAQHSCPLEVHNGILQVATSTAVWAQNLSFERRRILKKLNQRAHFQILRLKEIRFSTAQWHNRPGSSGALTVDKRLNSYQQQMQWQQHPSRLPPPGNERQNLEQAESATQAFDRWSQRRQQQVNQVPPCPQCQAPAPEGELQRWGVCAFCMAQQWQADKNANQPDGTEEAEDWKKGPPSSLTVEEARQARTVESSPDLSDPETPFPDTSDPGNSHPEIGTPDPGKRPSPVNGVMFQRLQSKLAVPSPQLPTQQQPPRKPAPPRQLQPRAGLPPVAWPTPIASSGAVPQSALEAEPPKPAVNPPNPALPRVTLINRNDAKPVSSTGLFQDPALTGPLAPLHRSELEAATASAESLPEQKTRNRPPEAQQQAAWAQAFQSLQSEEAQRQRQQMELQQRRAAQIRQVRRDREANDIPSLSQLASSDASTSTKAITPQAGGPAIAIQKTSQEACQETSELASGRSKPVLKKKR